MLRWKAHDTLGDTHDSVLENYRGNTGSSVGTDKRNRGASELGLCSSMSTLRSGNMVVEEEQPVQVPGPPVLSSSQQLLGTKIVNSHNTGRGSPREGK